MGKHASGSWYEIQTMAGRVALLGAALCGVLSLAGTSVIAQDPAKDKSGVNVTVTSKDGSEAGLVISAQATAKEAGLPLYPGATPSKEDGDGSAAANLGLWGSSFGFKLVVLKMESTDSPKKIASYYQKALARYGTVLDCTNAVPPPQTKDEKSQKLTCGDDKPDPGGILFKAGSNEKKHLVGIQPKGNGALFQLLYIEARGEKKKPA